MRKNLVFVPVGDNSLHIAWFKENRNFDLCVNYYGNNKEIEDKYRKNSDYFFNFKGYAFELFIKILYENDFWKSYEYIQKIDDDIDIKCEDLNLCFEYCKKYSFKLAQPSTSKKNSCYKHLVNRINSYYRYVDFIEIQMPIWEQETFKNKIYPLLLKNKDIIKCGWGVDMVMPYLLDFSDMAVIDKAIGNHTKPVSMSGWYMRMPLPPYLEELILLKRCKVKKFVCDKEGKINQVKKFEKYEKV